MNKEFVPYEQALALKKLGFNEPCVAIYRHGRIYYLLTFSVINSIKQSVIAAPLYQQAFRWFREKYDLFGCIDLHTSTPIHWYIRIDDIIKNDYVYHSEDENLKYNTYEEAELECLKQLIEIVKNK
jgi:hypothetical protein